MSNKKKIVIFTSDLFGLKIYNLIKRNKKYNIYLIISNKNKTLINHLKKSNINIYSYYEDLDKKKNLIDFQNNNFDLLISVYFNKILKKNIYNFVKKTINFHPSYLPLHKGCYPHVHSLLTGKGSGFTFHEIDKNIDSGNIWYQKKIFPTFLDDQISFHNKLKKEMLKQFKIKFELILNNKIKSKPQNSKGNYNNLKSLQEIDKLDLNKKYKLKDLILILNARKYKKNTFAYFQYESKIYKLIMKIF